MQKTVAIVGGDLRQVHLANTFIDKNPEYSFFGMFLEQDTKLNYQIHKTNDIKFAMKKSDIVIFPLPLLDANGFINTPQSAEKVTVEQFLDVIQQNTIVLGGMVSEQVKAEALKRGIEVIDYFGREEFQVLNAVPTAFDKIR